jgi:hypothetical protein
MKKIMSLIVTIAMLVSHCDASQMARIRSKHLLVSEALGSVTLRHDGESFLVKQGESTHKVASYDLDPVLRKLDKTNLCNYLKHGKIGVHKLSDGSFALRSNIQGLGGGPVAGAIAYWLTKSICISVPIVALGAATVATGGVAGAGMAMASSYTGGVIVAASGAAGAAAGNIAVIAAGYAPIAATEIAVGISGAAISGGGLAGAITTIEAASLGAWAVFTSCPFLP